MAPLAAWLDRPAAALRACLCPLASRVRPLRSVGTQEPQLGGGRGILGTALEGGVALVARPMGARAGTAGRGHVRVGRVC